MRTKRGVEAPIHVLVHASVALDEHALAGELNYDQYHIAKTRRVPLLWGDEELVLGGRPLTMYLETESASTMHIKWAGDMRAFSGGICSRTACVGFLRQVKPV